LNIPNVYENKNYKWLAVIPLLLMAASLYYAQQIPVGIDLRGGLLLTVYSEEAVDEAAIKGALSDYSDVEVRGFSNPVGSGVEIELPNDPALEEADNALKELLYNSRAHARAQVAAAFYEGGGEGNASEKQKAFEEKARLEALVLKQSARVLELTSGESVPQDANEAVVLAEESFNEARSEYRSGLLQRVSSVANVENYSFKEIGSSLSKFFFNKTQEILIYSFVLSTIVVFAIFRSLVPGFAVIFAAIADILITAGVMGAVGIPLTLASIAGLLMLIGLSLDTDALLTVRVVKRREGSPAGRAANTLKTAGMMNLTTIIAFTVLALIASLLQIPTYYQIGVVVVIGAVADFVTTWCFNAVILLWHVEGRK
jgi:preprotein translocase subunit SecF